LSYKNELDEVEKRLKALSRIHKPGQWKPESYVGNNSSRYTFLNLRVPKIRKAMQEGYSFSNLSFDHQFKIWTYIWNQTEYFEVALSALHFVNKSPVEDLFKHYKKLLIWQNKVDNWGHSDELSNAYARLLEYQPKEIFPAFEKWNQSDNPWKVRQSLVGLFFYSRFRTKYISSRIVLKFIKPHLNHSHYYVQKAVGWTLRECWNVYPEVTFNFMKKNAKAIPPAGWTAATEKLNQKDKKELMTIRKS
tara:strand:- start:1472 stop:2215 length:744 start_codon:yes stop_codon:yes gene_type:complete